MNDSVKKKYWVCFLIIGFILVADQVLKIWIKTHLAIGGDIPLIGEWCRLHFVENEGIAFGVSFGGNTGKFILSTFRVLASAFIMYLLVRSIKKDAHYLLLISVSMIFVGAVGNVVDGCFYGIIFSESTYTDIAVMFPEGGGYAPFFFGKVVDMFYFPLCEWTWPEWMPVYGGCHAEFFNAIFNIADASICVGVAILIVDQLVHWKDEKPENNEPAEEKEVA